MHGHGHEERAGYVGSTKRTWEWSQALGSHIHELTGINQQLISWLVRVANAENKEMYTCLKEGPSVISTADVRRSHTSLGVCMLLRYILPVFLPVSMCVSTCISHKVEILHLILFCVLLFSLNIVL